MPMMAAAASNAENVGANAEMPACKRRANYLKLKEIGM